MKVLIISSSPRKEGNSDVLCDRFAKGVSEAGHEVEKIILSSRLFFSLQCICSCKDPLKLA